MSFPNQLLSSYSLFTSLCTDGFFRPNDSSQIRLQCRRNLSDIKSFSFVFLVIEEIQSFLSELQNIKVPIFLIVGRSDESFDSRFDFLLDHPCILHVFAQNCDHIAHPRLTPLPLGFENPGWLYEGNPTNNVPLLMQESRLSLTCQKHDVILSAFNIQTNILKRSEAAYYLRRSTLPVYFFDFPGSHTIKSQQLFYKAMASSKFVACPHGNGIDCHRIWQALLMGATPISTFSPALVPFQKLGLILLDNWCDLLSLSFVDLTERSVVLAPPRELSTRYWVEFIKSRANSIALD